MIQGPTTEKELSFLDDWIGQHRRERGESRAAIVIAAGAREAEFQRLQSYLAAFRLRGDHLSLAGRPATPAEMIEVKRAIARVETLLQELVDMRAVLDQHYMGEQSVET